MATITESTTPAYVPGRSIKEAQQASGLTEILKLASNENALGPSPRARAAIEAALAELHLYPGEEHEAALLQKLAGWLGAGLGVKNLVLGNGSADVLRFITQTFIEPGDRAVIAAPTFRVYEILVKLYGGQVTLAPLRDYRVDSAALLSAIDDEVKLVFICNPNNPTGSLMTHDEVHSFLRRVPPRVITVIDEAYMDFADDPALPRMPELIQAGYNVIVTRTFSKLYGLASLRMGYGLGRPDLIAAVQRQKLHFHTGRIALAGAIAALDDTEHVARTQEMVRTGREFFYRRLPELGLKCLPSQGNFIFLVDLPMDALALCDAALRRGLILRPTDSFDLPENIRITIGRPEDNERVIHILREILVSSQ
ncbi:MAG: histidinol-phosphate transaminase [Anaerolineae bacterium]